MTGYLIGVDIGGTFTDCAVIAPGGSVHSGKVPTRPDDRAGGFFAAIESVAVTIGMTLTELLERCELLVHGTTTGTNALLTGSGAAVGLLTTVGHRDATLIMKGSGRLAGLSGDEVLRMPDTDKPKPLVPRSRIAEVVQRTDFEGDVIVALDEASVRTGIAELQDAGAESVAVSLLWSTRNSEHERRVAELVGERDDALFVSCSAELSSRVGEYERTMTSIVNSYIGPMMRRYVDALEATAEGHGYRGRLLYTQCAGGAVLGEEARRAPVRTLHSGPVSGVMGSARLAALMGEPDLIVTDLGGTSFDVSILQGGAPEVRQVSMVGRYEIAQPMVVIDTIGAGGGSIAWIDDAGGLRVGPQSAGAVPGPACYGQGGTAPTVTDADVVLGVIDPDNFLHGTMRLDVAAAEAAIGTVAESLGLDLVETAAGIVRLIDSRMADLVRRMTVMQGLDPRDFACFAYGGSGPAHIGAVATELGISKVIVPMLHAAPVWSAFGAAMADVSHVQQRWVELDLATAAARMDEILAELEQEGEALLSSEGFASQAMRLERTVRVKYRTQIFDLEVPVPAGPIDATALEEDFERVYERKHGVGTGYRAGGVVVTGLAVRAVGRTHEATLAPAADDALVEWRSRPVYWQEERAFVDTSVLRLARGAVDERLTGPMLVELPDTVVAVRPGQQARFDGYGSLILSPEVPA